MVEFRIADRDLRILRIRSVRREEAHPVLGDAEVRAEATAAIHHLEIRAIQHRRSRVLYGRRAVARPRQAIVVALDVVAGLLVDDRLHAAQRLRIEVLLQAHMRLEALGRLAGVADGPIARVDLARHVLDQRLLVLVLRPGVHLHDLDVLDELRAEAEFLREGQHDGVVGARLEERLDHLFPPLDGTVRRRDRARGLELRRGREEVDAVLAVGHRGSGRRIRVDDDHEVDLLHRLLHLEAARLRVGRMSPVDDRAQVRVLVDELVLLEDAVDPARHRHAGLFHHRLRREAALHPLVVDAPDLAPMLPRAFGDAVVAGQRIRVRADVGRALHVVVAAIDVRAAAGDADVSERELQDARGAHERVADGVLRLPHAPHDRRRPVLRHRFGRGIDVGFGNPGHFRDLVGRPFLQHLFLDLVHAVDAVVDVLLVFPAVLEDVVQHTEDERDVGARAEADVLVGLRRGAREARVGDDHLRAGLLRVQAVQHRDRVRLGRVRPDEEHALRVLQVVVRIRHCAVAPRIGYARDGG